MCVCIFFCFGREGKKFGSTAHALSFIHFFFFFYREWEMEKLGIIGPPRFLFFFFSYNFLFLFFFVCLSFCSLFFLSLSPFFYALHIFFKNFDEFGQNWVFTTIIGRMNTIQLDIHLKFIFLKSSLKSSYARMPASNFNSYIDFSFSLCISILSLLFYTRVLEN